jgi:hypothetical protein
MTSRDTYISSVSANHTNAEHAGISLAAGQNLPGAPTLPGNATAWSRDVARAAFANGTITQSQFVAALQAIASWEQAQNSLAKATLRATGDVNPV